MIYEPKHFILEELVCPHVFYQFKKQSWQFLDPYQLILMDWIRDRLGETYINNWDQYLDSTFIKYIRESIENKLPIFPFQEPKPPTELLYQRGFRCNICALSYAKTQAGMIYVSGHFLGKADDFNVKRMTSGNVRQYLFQNMDEIPYNIRLEKNTSWVHLDTEDAGEKIHLF